MFFSPSRSSTRWDIPTMLAASCIAAGLCLGHPSVAVAQTADVPNAALIPDVVSPSPDASPTFGDLINSAASEFGAPEISPITQQYVEDLESLQAASVPLDASGQPKKRYWLNRRNERLKNYVQADYLLWWADDSELPELLQTNPTGTPIGDVGRAATTSTVIGGQSVGDWPHSGLRLRFGRFVSDSRVSRVELDLWHLFEDSDSFSAGSADGSTILSRPFINTSDPNNPIIDGQLISFPGLASGNFNVDYNRTAFGVDPTIFFCVGSSDCRWLEFSTGYRFLYLRDQLDLRERVIYEPGGLIAPGSGYEVRDQFTAANQLHLWNIGLSHTENHGDWLLNVRGQVGLGINRREVEVEGSTTSFVGDQITSADDAGFLALQTNRGTHDETDFAWVPELSANLKRRLGKHVSAHVGYTLIFLPDAVQAVDHVPTRIDPGNLPIEQPGAGPDPEFKFVTDDILLHGFNFGLRYDW